MIALGGTPSDLVLDESRQRIYLINNSGEQSGCLQIGGNAVVQSIGVGRTPIAGAMSMDNSTLYVTNQQDSTVSVIDLGSMSVSQTISLPAAPQGVEVGLDGTSAGQHRGHHGWREHAADP